MQLKPQDIVVLLKLVSLDGDWTYRSLAQELFISIGEVHNALSRTEKAHLFNARQRRPYMQPLEEFLIHGVKYAFPSEHGSLTRGMPTAYAAPPLNRIIVQPENDDPPVWPDPEGSARGYKLKPLYQNVPEAAKLDKRLYEMLALLDAIRDGRARERNLAAEHLQKYLRAKHEET